jgi:hypothetical protein
MPTTAIRGIGTLVKKGATTITNIKSVDGPTPKAEREEITSLDSAGGYKEFMSSDIDPGELKCEAYWDKTVYNAILADLQAGTVAEYSITIATSPAATYTFNAFVSDCPMKIDPKAISFTFTLSITGPIVAA